VGASSREQGKTLHKREVRRQIVLPVILVTMAVLALGAFVVLPLDGTQNQRLQALTDLFAVLLLICPMIICQFGLILGLIVVVYGANKLHHGAQKPLERIEGWTEKLATKTTEITENVNQRAIRWTSILEPFIRFTRLFDESETTEGANDGKPKK